MFLFFLHFRLRPLYFSSLVSIILAQLSLFFYFPHMLNYLIRISFCVFCFVVCVFSFISIIILLYIILFQFNIIIHTHVSPGWLLLISFFVFIFLSFLRGSWFYLLVFLPFYPSFRIHFPYSFP